jgi:hypothetical protein
VTIKITWKYLAGFIALNMLLGELHEQAHIQTGYAICGCYGTRDISSWTTCTNCTHAAYALWATAAGPLFSYLVYWVAAFGLLISSSETYRRIGLAVLFASLPFARIFTAVMGGGDEKVVLMGLFNQQIPALALKILTILVVLLFCLPPLLAGIKKLPVVNRWLYATGFIIGPLLFGICWQRFFLNGLLARGIGAEPVIAGTPLLVIAHFIVMCIIFLFFGKHLIKTSAEDNQSRKTG